MMNHKRFYRLVLCLALLGATKKVFSQTDFWQPLNGPGAVMFALAINSSGHLFVGTFYGVYRSPDDGQSWEQVGVINKKVIAFAINTSGHIFAGTELDGIFRSRDNGQSWIAINAGLANPCAETFAINDSGHIFVGTNGGGTFRSINNGDSWTAINSGLTNTIVNALAINSIGHIFAGTGSRTSPGMVFRSIDNGINWTRANSGITSEIIESLAINPTTHGIFAGTDVLIQPSGGTMWRSVNHGESWTLKNFGLPHFAVATALAINARGYIFAAVPPDGIFHSVNNGDSWIEFNSGLTDPRVRAIAIDSRGHIFAVTNGGGVFKSIQPTTAVKEVEYDFPKTFALEQNYPNPFSAIGVFDQSETTFQFTLPRSGYVTLKIYNTLGIEVKTLVAEYLSVGRHEAKLNVAEMANGIYFYRLQAGKFSQTKKLVVAK